MSATALTIVGAWEHVNSTWETPHRLGADGLRGRPSLLLVPVSPRRCAAGADSVFGVGSGGVRHVRRARFMRHQR